MILHLTCLSVRLPIEVPYDLSKHMLPNSHLFLFSLHRLDLDLGDLRFLQGIPKDGLVEDTCLFETFSRWLNVECDQAIIIVMVCEDTFV